MAAMDESSRPKRRVGKLKRVPDTHCIRKRPPQRPSIPSPYSNSSSQKVVYVSSKTPFISAVKRVQKLLALADKRSLGRINLEQKASDRHLLNVLSKEKERKAQGEEEEIVLKGTGKAIEKVLSLALFFQGQADHKVQIRTGSLSVVDDIVENDHEEPEEVTVEDAEAVPEFQIRRTSVLEVGLRLR